ncbi:DUF3445 domain-containing protein [Erythrobacter sp. YT30]|uniref:heme-dependent oxidative N-demethylase family protein n=1 Tax=Erythrobacter sp. YT30 TaxID=1735012 RepID=UPI002687F088
MGLVRLTEPEWLQPAPDLAARREAFANWPEGIQITSASEEPGRELAGMLDVAGGLPEAALNAHEDMCLLTRRPGEDVYRLIGAAVAWPSDWHPKHKVGLPLRALHAPIQGYEEQLATGVDRFMATLKSGVIYGRCNWFIAPTRAKRWIAGGDPQKQFEHITPKNAGDCLFVRSERQTLRRLPETGAILFTIGIYVEPFAALTADNRSRLADALRNLVSGEGDRRGATYYADALLQYHQRTTP